MTLLEIASKVTNSLFIFVVPKSASSEHRLVIQTLQETAKTQPDRKCFRLIGGVLVEKTVKDVLPALETGVKGVSVEGCAQRLAAFDCLNHTDTDIPNTRTSSSNKSSTH